MSMCVTECEMCYRPIDELKVPVRLQYSNDSELLFCSPRCKRDYLDSLPPQSLIVQRHAEDVDMVPWGVAYE